MRTSRGTTNTDTHHKTVVRIPDELWAAIVAAAEERDVSANWLIVRGMEDFLERLAPTMKLTVS